jgi:hypothetical protein
MIDLQLVMWTLAFFFAFIGFRRGWNKELIAMSGLILALFALHQFDNLIRNVFLGNLPNDWKFAIQTTFFSVVAFFAYQTRAAMPNERRGGDGRDRTQESVLGALLGFVNGYLIWGSVWYFLDINGYPSSLNVLPPSDRSVVNVLPLFLLAGGPQGSGDLISLAVILLFLFVLIVI